MSFTNISTELYIEKLSAELSRLYPDEQFLYEELDGIVQGLVNSVSWSALKCAQEQAEDGLIARPVEAMNTIDHFCTAWMPREEIIYRIENTSGLSDDIAAQALKIIERLTDNLVEENNQIFIEHVGSINSTQPGIYSIELASEILIKPDSAKTTQVLRSAGASGSI